MPEKLRRFTAMEAQTMDWETKEIMEREFKKNRVKLVGADYEPKQDQDGKWRLFGRPAPTEQETNVVDIGAAKKKAAAPKKTAAAPPKKAAAKKQAAEPEGPKEYKGPEVKGGPNISTLPDGFVNWAVEQACRTQGVSRKLLGEKCGQNSVKWFEWARGVAKEKGLKVRTGREGKYNNVWMWKD